MLGILQGPYRDTRFLTHVCWTGVYSLFRMTLVLLKTFITTPVVRLCVMFQLIMFYLFLHCLVEPYRDRLSNTASLLSSLTLALLCTVNIVRAIYISEGTHHDPLNLIDNLNIVEDVFMLWLPLIGAAVIVVILVLRVLVEIIALCNRIKNTNK